MHGSLATGWECRRMCNEINCTPVLIIIMIRSRTSEYSNILGLAGQIFLAHGVCEFDRLPSQSLDLLAGNQHISVATSLADNDNCAILIN
jgi:hypothetical protein